MTVFKKTRLRERVGPHTEAHPSDPTLEVVVMPGQVFLAPEHRAQRWHEKMEIMPDDMPVSPDLFIRQKNAGPGVVPPTPEPKTRAEKVLDKGAQAAAVMGTVEAMTLEELRKFAADESIDLGKSKNRDEALKIVKAALIA